MRWCRKEETMNPIDHLASCLDDLDRHPPVLSSVLLSFHPSRCVESPCTHSPDYPQMAAEYKCKNWH